jgi:DHA1 family bicyclomycin/chloramphenicol resistance-like MFS transporter
VAENRGISSIRFSEFVALAAATMSTQAIAIDAMLPAFPIIVRALGVEDPNHGQWIVTAYMTGLGIGQSFWGLISDRFGRRRILLSGLSLYVIASFVCTLAPTFQMLLAARFVHGLAAASVTVIRSVVRDLYSGRHMARVMSLTFVVFLTVPVMAPSIGQLILLAAPWRYIFAVFGTFAAGVAIWLAVRLPETLHPEYRLTLSPGNILRAVKLVLGQRTSFFYTLAMMVLFGALIAYVGEVQQIFTDVFHRPKLMPTMFALCAIFMGCAAYGNSRFVERLGMRPISHAGLLIYIATTALHSVVTYLGLEQIWTFVLFQAVTMACFSLSVSNFGAMAMEPVGSVAGVAASLQGFISTFSGALVGAFIGRQYNGSVFPLAINSLGCGIVALCFVLIAERGRLFRMQHGEHGGMIAEGAGSH